MTPLTDGQNLSSEQIKVCRDKWVVATSSLERASVVQGTFTESREATGPDIYADSKLEELIEIQVFLSSIQNSESSAFRCIRHIEDVPADGSCGYHALSKATSSFGGSTAIGSETPTCAEDTRLLFVEYIKRYRGDIEYEVERSLGQQRAKYYLWDGRITTDGSAPIN